MASQLEDKVQYGLLSSGFSGADKTILQFKLTDSSLKSIEEYLLAKSNCSKKPRIHFKGNLGVLTVPWYDERSKKSKKHEYQFTVLPIQAPEKSSLECIQQFRNKRGSEQLDSIGAIQTKINIQATDEAFKRTQELVKKVDENKRSVSTQELDQADHLKWGKKVKKSYAIKDASPSLTKSVSSSVSSAQTRTSNVTSSSSQSFQQSAIPTPKPIPKPPATFHNTIKSTQLKQPSGNSSSSRKSVVYHKPCRERIIHLLALKPYKKPEIVLRLKTDGISDKERQKIGATLQEVGTMKDNTYNLHKSLYSQVREDWPQYTDEDRKNLRRRIEQLRTKESPVRSQPSPLPARVDMDANTVKRKRIILPEVTDYTERKKARIAHNRSHQMQEGKNSPSDSHSQPPTPQGATYKPPTPQGGTYKPPTPQGGPYHPSVSSPSISTTKCSPDSSYSSDPIPAAKAIPKNARERREVEERYSPPIVGKENNHHHNHHHHRENHSPAGQVSSSAPDYIMEFPPITSKEQRIRYKEHFYKEYPEYERLCKDIMRVTELFTDLKNRLAKAEVGSLKHDQIKEEIIAENKNVQKGNNFKSMNSRFKYLHEKLGHMKQMIANYDEGSCS